MAIPNAFDAKELEQLGVTDSRDFPLDGEMRRALLSDRYTGGVSRPEI